MKHTLTKRRTFFIYIGNEMIERTLALFKLYYYFILSVTLGSSKCQTRFTVRHKDEGRGCLDWDAEAGSFSPYLPPDVFVVAFGL